MSKRPFDFSDDVKVQALIRQSMHCGHCGKKLTYMVEHAHHVIPNQVGVKGAPADQFLRSIDNCVIVCDACHNRVHGDGHFRDGAVAPPDYFRYSHGPLNDDGQINGAHAVWINIINKEWAVRFP